MSTALLLGLVLLATPQDDVPWFQLYDQGVAAIEQGRAREAGPLLEAALAKRADEGLRLRTSGVYLVDYMPYLYLAIASQMSGDLEAARRYVAAAEKSGVAAASEVVAMVPGTLFRCSRGNVPAGGRRHATREPGSGRGWVLPRLQPRR